MRTLLASATLGLGYLLIFAAVADGGRYAGRPWDAFQA